MANSGKNSNTSGFFFLFSEDQAVCFIFDFDLIPKAKVNGKYVAFGTITDGLTVLDKLEAIGTQEGHTTKKAFIHNCGMF